MKKFNKGFTLVELLAVIAIMAVLVILALPAVLKIFNDSKENAFVTQAQSIFKAGEQQYIMGQISSSPITEFCKSSTNTTSEIKLTGNSSNLQYKMLFSDGQPVYFVVTDGTSTVTAYKKSGGSEIPVPTTNTELVTVEMIKKHDSVINVTCP